MKLGIFRRIYMESLGLDFKSVLQINHYFLFSTFKNHKHKFDMYDIEHDKEYGHCQSCGNWIDLDTDKAEVIKN